MQLECTQMIFGVPLVEFCITGAFLHCRRRVWKGEMQKCIKTRAIGSIAIFFRRLYINLLIPSFHPSFSPPPQESRGPASVLWVCWTRCCGCKWAVLISVPWIKPFCRQLLFCRKIETCWCFKKSDYGLNFDWLSMQPLHFWSVAHRCCMAWKRHCEIQGVVIKGIQGIAMVFGCSFNPCLCGSGIRIAFQPS